VSAIGHIDNIYSQNFKSIRLYEEALLSNHLPIERGYILNADDLLRQDIINQITCHNGINIKSIEQKHSITFADYFSQELTKLRQCEEEGLIEISTTQIQLTSLGRLVIRRICMIFDIYTVTNEESKRYSRIL